MKAFKMILGSFLFLALTAYSTTAQEFTLTTTSANTVSSKATIDLPGLNGNPQAVIVATPVAGTETLNPHPIGAWYYNGKWNIFNTDHAPMPLGAKYNVQYFPQPSPSHFVHVIPMGGPTTVPRTYLDYPLFDNRPNVQFKILQNHAPDHRAFYLNQSEAKAEYDAANGKWFIQNVNGTALHPNTSYNIVITSSGTVGSIIVKPNGKTTIATPPAGNAGGDLSGAYPNPTVQKLLGRPLSNVAPTVGQLLRWNGTEWEPVTYNAGVGLSLNGTIFSARNTAPLWNANQILGRDVANTAPAVGQVLKWTGTAWAPAEDNGALPKTYYKYTSNSLGSMEVGVNDNNEVKIPSISGIALTVTQPSTLVVSAHFYGRPYCGQVNFSCMTEIWFYYKVNNNASTRVAYNGGEHFSGAMSNHFYNVPAGTYTIDFYSRKLSDFGSSQLNYAIAGGYATVLVLPR